MSTPNPRPLDMDITVLSAEGLKKPSCFMFSKPLRPFIALTTTTSSAPYGERNNGGEEDRVGLNWGDKFHVHVSSSFFTDLNAFIHLQLFNKRSFAKGWTVLGWCRVPATDVVSSPVDPVKYLSYRLLARDGTRSDAVINLAVEGGSSFDTREKCSSNNCGAVTSYIGGSLDAHGKCSSDNGRATTSQIAESSDAREKWSRNDGGAETSRTVIGIPVKYCQFPMR